MDVPVYVPTRLRVGRHLRADERERTEDDGDLLSSFIFGAIPFIRSTLVAARDVLKLQADNFAPGNQTSRFITAITTP